MKAFRFLCAVVLTGLASASASAAPIVETTISSGNCSFGYGVVAGFWGTSETASANTSTTSGSFSFVPTVSGSGNSSFGPRFGPPARTLQSGGVSPSVADTGATVGSFLASIAATWSGSTPVDAQPSPNYRLRVNITSLRIWSAGYDGDTGPYTQNFNETTAGHAASSPSTTILAVPFTTWYDKNNYTQIVWDPSEFIVTGTSSTRTFTLGGSPSSSIDAFEVFGTVDLIYDAIPEPGAAGLALTAMLGMALRRRR